MWLDQYMNRNQPGTGTKMNITVELSPRQVRLIKSAILDVASNHWPSTGLVVNELLDIVAVLADASSE